MGEDVTTESAPARLHQPPGRLGPWLAGIWLLFLLDPLRSGWERRADPRAAIGIVVTLAFAVAYMLVWVDARRRRHWLQLSPPLLRGSAYFGVLLALGVGMVLTLGESGLACTVYLAATAVLVFGVRTSLAFAVVEIGLVLLLGRVVPHWTGLGSLAISIGAAFLAVFGVVSMMRRNIDLIRAHEENARLVVDNERNRFARDLHDILGHSLTVITVKAQLAGRLLDVDPARARAELEDLERLSRDALADVRHAVHGYRDLTLPGELARARTALEAAGIEAELPSAADEVDSRVRELFAWTVREGVTNVIRHSGAGHCSVRLTPTKVEIVDDGVGVHGSAPGPQGLAYGAGLLGLRERAAAVGGIVVTRSLSPGFALEVGV